MLSDKILVALLAYKRVNVVRCLVLGPPIGYQFCYIHDRARTRREHIHVLADHGNISLPQLLRLVVLLEGAGNGFDERQLFRWRELLNFFNNGL